MLINISTTIGVINPFYFFYKVIDTTSCLLSSLVVTIDVLTDISSISISLTAKYTATTTWRTHASSLDSVSSTTFAATTYI